MKRIAMIMRRRVKMLNSYLALYLTFSYTLPLFLLYSCLIISLGVNLIRKPPILVPVQESFLKWVNESKHSCFNRYLNIIETNNQAEIKKNKRKLLLAYPKTFRENVAIYDQHRVNSVSSNPQVSIKIIHDSVTNLEEFDSKPKQIQKMEDNKDVLIKLKRAFEYKDVLIKLKRAFQFQNSSLKQMIKIVMRIYKL
ncbi:hypothetical protein MXB_2358 [Myxobolus squamalis]|nr:hypothetical protein MXB_2358 [Myxobolus squamalis]